MPSTPIQITGVMTWSEGGAPPVVSPPIHLGPGGGGVVAPPIYYPPSVQPPLFPSQPIYLPAPQPPQIWPSPGVPTHPIVIPQPPVGIWPSPGHPSQPIYLPPYVQPPLFPTQLPVLPGGGTPPAEIPPGSPQWIYSPQLGWIIVWVPPGEGGKPQPPLEPPIASQLPS